MPHIQTPAAVVGDGTASTFQHTFASNVTAGSAIFVCSTTVTQTVTAVSDSLGNIYKQVGSGFTAAGVTNQIWYALNILGGACVVTLTTSANAECTSTASEYSGVNPGSAVDVSGGASGATNLATVSLVTTNDNDILIAAMSHNSAQVTLTPGSGFAMLQEVEDATHMPFHSEHRQVDATGTYAAEVILGGSVSWKIFAAAFRQLTSYGVGRYLKESGSPDGYLLEDGSGVLLKEDGVPAAGRPMSDAVHRSFSW